ncbi:UDP-N-acetylmuramoylalanyl-D-glutamyl-2,6- diaminopimelate--D-alanyl-D-alanine ligase [Alkalibacterium sp. AK22]|uniref:UDP-N-acetylmuramoyl-tripeptide--D-alanyl-D- alanine ligase n=1 Tax=Alkalibacterium sp. AK22 TaxID=1229520 RepID=UPI000448D034|nr:UDP-N-acetylmuramoyl-tripeptide--D-alanyl-D-alanine ligase [Alkalibacterium sp. AK22]EXJ24039.1 UDP-N-acetylmuramoylalanyl-D-glutamyl-2,6- diaminopimelate--D-alanyl-D-alanine ligase [Alkalibacterium sp. AK22]
MAKWNLSEIAKATNGEVVSKDGKLTVEGVSFDTRTLQPNDLFIPLTAERNGHDFIGAAIEKGATASFWSDDLSKVPEGFPVIKVADTEKAFQLFAQYYLEQVNPKVVGVTGSNGKTTTKDMVAAVASSKYRTYKTVGNFNNHLGLPYTILNMPADTELLVLEMGMSERGEIEVLSALAQPDIAVITMIGESHIEFLGSREGISEAKLEIVSGMTDGVLIYPGEEPLLQDKIAGGYVQDTVSKILTFGRHKGMTLYPVEVEARLKQTVFKTNQKPDLACTLPVPGIYNVQNALAAVLVGQEIGVSIQEAYLQLENFELTRDRLEWKVGINQSVLLNDAYNASPSSMKAVLRYFQQIEAPARKIAVLGDILELGDYSKVMHESLSEAVDLEALDLLVLYGEEMKALYEALPDDTKGKVRHFTGDKQPLIELLGAELEPEDTVLLKSSRSTGMLEVVSELSLKAES